MIPRITVQDLSGVAETLLVTLYIRSIESQRPDALLKDARAVALVAQMDFDFSKFKFDKDDQVSVILRNREIDRLTGAFLSRNPGAVVVHIGCGLDSRFERVDDGQVTWYDLDLPEVIDLRRRLLGGEGPRYHLMPGSAFDDVWLNRLSDLRGRPILVLAEGVFAYFEETRVRQLILSLRDCLPGVELVCDAFSPYIVRMNNLRNRLTGVSARFHWSLKRAEDLEKWGEGIVLLDEWRIFDRPEPRLDSIRWMRHIPLFANTIGVFHYRLGSRRA